MQYFPLPSRYLVQMEPYGVWRWGANPMGESFNYFLLNYHFLRRALEMQYVSLGSFFCFRSATAVNGAINCHYPSIKPPHWVIVTLPPPFDAF